MRAQEKSMIPSVNPTRFEKLLGFAPPTQAGAMENAIPLQYVHRLAYMEDDMADIYEEDVWGDDDDDDDYTSSFGDEATTPSSKHWPDSESDSHFSASLDDEDVGKSRVLQILTPSQFSPSDREAMCGRQFNYIAPSQHGASGSINQAHDMMATPTHHGILLSNKNFSPGYGRSAPVEVPLWSRLCAMTKHGNNSVHVDANEDDEDDFVVERVPPHELLAKQHARSQISAFSVIEGAGRTLKGRDVSKVRDAVWKQTGFYG